MTHSSANLPRRLRAALVICTLLASLTGCALRPIPTVDDLVANYETNRSDFERLVAVTPPDADFEFELQQYNLTGEGIDPRVVGQLAGPLVAVGGERLAAGGEGLRVLLGETGMVSSGFEWGYVHTSEVPSETVAIEVARDPGELETWYYPLGDDWYAYEIRW